MRIESLEPGSRLMYPGHGVATLKRVLSQKIGGAEHKLFEFEIEISGTKITIPAGRLSSIGLRKFGTEREAQAVYELLGEKGAARARKADPHVLAQRLKGSLVEIAEVWRDLSTLATMKTLSLDEQKLRDVAQRLVASEIAAIRGGRPDAILKELKDIVVASHSKMIKQLASPFKVPAASAQI